MDPIGGDISQVNTQSSDNKVCFDLNKYDIPENDISENSPKYMPQGKVPSCDQKVSMARRTHNPPIKRNTQEFHMLAESPDPNQSSC